MEREKTLLAKYLPNDLLSSNSVEIVDIYLPKSDFTPNLRVRRYGDQFMIEKKSQVDEQDATHLNAEVIHLSRPEFDALENVEGLRIVKTRYFYNYEGREYQFDVFQEDLKGLVLIDVEFGSDEEMQKFIMPDFCLADVSQEKFVEAGMLGGESYENLKVYLDKYNYSKL